MRKQFIGLPEGEVLILRMAPRKVACCAFQLVGYHCGLVVRPGIWKRSPDAYRIQCRHLAMTNRAYDQIEHVPCHSNLAAGQDL